MTFLVGAETQSATTTDAAVIVTWISTDDDGEPDGGVREPRDPADPPPSLGMRMTLNVDKGRELV